MKKVTSACWACPFASKVAVGYSNGEIFIWSIPAITNSRTELNLDRATQNAPILKLNLGYKVDKIPIALLKWLYADGKASRLYVMGASDLASTNNLQVNDVLLLFFGKLMFFIFYVNDNIISCHLKQTHLVLVPSIGETLLCFLSCKFSAGCFFTCLSTKLAVKKI